MNAAILEGVDPAVAGAPVIRVQPKSDEYARFCNYCGIYFIEKKRRGRLFQFCQLHRTASCRASRAKAKKQGKPFVPPHSRRFVKKSNLGISVHMDGADLAPVGNIAIKRICVNPHCGREFLARHPAAIYCDLDCYSETRHHKRAD